MKELALITTLNITVAFETRHFQVRIPSDASSICAVELALRSKGLPGDKAVPEEGILLYGRNLLYGDVMLFSCEKGNCFYTGELHEEDRNTLMFDFGKTEEDGFSCRTHGTKQEAEEITVDGDTTVVSGVYRDKAGKDISVAGGYEVKIIIWIKTSD